MIIICTVWESYYGCPSVAGFGASWQETMSTTSCRTWIQATYWQQLTLSTVIHTGAQYLSSARVRCPLVMPSLQREESISHGQMFTLQMQQRTESSWGKVLQVTMRAPLDLVHPDYYQQLLRVVCYQARSWGGKIRTSPFIRSASEAEKLPVWGRIVNQQRWVWTKTFHNACLLWFKTVLFQTIIC